MSTARQPDEGESLETNPDVTEVLVERVKPQRFAEARGEYDTFFNAYNYRAMAARGNEWSS